MSCPDGMTPSKNGIGCENMPPKASGATYGRGRGGINTSFKRGGRTRPRPTGKRMARGGRVTGRKPASRRMARGGRIAGRRTASRRMSAPRRMKRGGVVRQVRGRRTKPMMRRRR